MTEFAYLRLRVNLIYPCKVCALNPGDRRSESSVRYRWMGLSSRTNGGQMIKGPAAVSGDRASELVFLRSGGSV